MGMSFGGITASLLSELFPAEPHDFRLLIHMGMAGWWASVLRSPVTGILVTFVPSAVEEKGLTTGFTTPLILTAMVAHVTSSQFNASDFYVRFLDQDGFNLALIWVHGAPLVLKERHKEIHRRNQHILNAAERAQQDQVIADNVSIHRFLKARNVMGLHTHLVRTHSNVNWTNPVTRMSPLSLAIDRGLANAAHLLLHRQVRAMCKISEKTGVVGQLGLLYIFCAVGEL